MRNKIYTLTAILIIAVLYYFFVSAFKSEVKTPERGTAPDINSTVRDTFTNCIFNSSFNEINSPTWNLGEQLHVARNLGRYKELNFNAVHQYDEIGSGVYGWADTPLSAPQISNYRLFLDSVKLDTLYGFFERSFLSKYCYGQRLIYEIPEQQNDITTNYGFVYSNSECGSHDIDQGRTVIHAEPGIHDAGNICYDIFENLQHTDLFHFRQNDKGTWFIKPEMRIPTGMPDNIPVVRIDVFAFDSTLIRQITINTENFKDSISGIYDGTYKDKFFALFPTLHISGKDSLASLNKGRGSDEGWLDWNTACHIDFRVHWYGQCEVWFDKMIVDDGRANELFNPVLQPIINSRIQQEVTNFTDRLYTFFTDEIFISQYPCIKYIVEKMRHDNPTSRISIAVTHNGDILGLKNDFLGYRIYLDSIKPDFLQDDHHGIQVGIPFGILKIPPTVPITDSRIPDTWKASSNDAYNLQLQDTTIGGKNDGSRTNYVGSLIYELRTVRDDITQYSSSTKFIMQPQIHGWITPENNGLFYKSGNREPLNEEIQVQAMVSIAHGANGLCWFVYNSHIWTDSTSKPIFYMVGLLDPIDNLSKRENNCYGQNKWQYVSNMNLKIQNWTPTLENSNWIDGATVCIKMVQIISLSRILEAFIATTPIHLQIILLVNFAILLNTGKKDFLHQKTYKKS